MNILDQNKFKNISHLFDVVGTTPDKRNSLLEYIKRNSHLYQDLLTKTAFLDNQYLVQPLSQRLYHLIHKLNQPVPTNIVGWYLKYKNFKDGYSSTEIQDVRNCEWANLQDHEIEKYFKSFNSGIRNCFLKQWLVNKTPFLDPYNASIKTRAFYYRKNINYPLVDYKSKKLIWLVSEKRANELKSVIEPFIKMTDEEKIDFLNNFLHLKNRERAVYNSFLRQCTPITDYIDQNTNHIPGLVESRNLTSSIWHLVNRIKTLPLCRHCGNQIQPSKFNHKYLKYPLTCSHECNNKCIEVIEKRLKNNSTNQNGYCTNIGENEKYLLSLIERVKKLDISYNKRFGPYFLDGFDEQNNLAIEIQETRHSYTKQFEKDKKKINFLLEKGCSVLMILDNWHNPKAKKTKFQKTYEVYFRSLRNVTVLNINTSNGKVLTDIGWSKFLEIRSSKVLSPLIKITTTRNKHIVCTEDHLLFSSNLYYKLAKEFNIGDLIQTQEGQERVKTIEHVDDINDVYDIVETENNSFFANGIKVHNCICLDEAAFIECLTGDTNITIKELNGQTTMNTIENLFEIL